MNKQQAFDELAANFGLKATDYYFLDLIPLIEMIWVDGVNQPAELDILYKFAIDHIAYLDRRAGVKVLDVKDANDFIERFALRRPPPELLQELRHLAGISAAGGDNPRNRTILEYCLDIAAACAPRYPYPIQHRIMPEEKDLLETLIREFHIDPHALLPD